MEELLRQGKVLPVMEEFYSIQGEGFHAGRAAWFIRIGGCDVGCYWCDIKESWKASEFPPIPVDEVVRRAAECPAKAAVVTGGEPMLYNLDYLCRGLRAAGVAVFLETSGSEKITGKWDWICLSPKRESPPLPESYRAADELKVIIHDLKDFDWAEENAIRAGKECLIYLQPEWSRAREMIPCIVEYTKHHPEWRISLQIHKYMRIP